MAATVPSVGTSELTKNPASGSDRIENPISTPPTANANIENSAGTIKLPFPHPAESSKPPPAPPLTADQLTKYNSLLSTVTSWTTVPTTPVAKSPTAPITDSERMWLTRECLLRYLRATKWSVNDARARLLCTLGWRREYGVEALTAGYIGPENATGKQIINGYDLGARPCLYLNPAQQNTSDNEKQIQHLVYSLERCADLMHPGQDTVCLLINFKGATKLPSAGQGKQSLHILQTHYPERMGKALVINIPWLVWTFLKIISPFIDPNTREKIKTDEDLRLYVPAKQLLKSYGGDVDFEYDHDIYWPTINELAARRRQEQVDRWVRAGKRVGEIEEYIKGGNVRCLREMEEAGEGAGEDGGKEGVENGGAVVDGGDRK